MLIPIPAYYPNEVITIPIRTKTPQRIVCKVRHESQPLTTYFDTSSVINGTTQFTVRVPNAPKAGMILELYNSANGNIDHDPTFQYKITVDPLVIPIQRMKSKVARDFKAFLDDFCEDAGIIPARNKIYKSLDGKFRIDYKDTILDDKGNELTTPARVDKNSKIIEVSKKYFDQYSVPERKFILLHEFAHVYQNKEVYGGDASNEYLADKSAIYLGLGWGLPRISAIKVFTKVFNNADSPLNRRRVEAIKYYIDNFDTILKNNQVFN